MQPAQPTDPNMAPKKKGMSGLKIAMIILGILFVVVAGSCGTCVYLAGNRLGPVTEPADTLNTARKDYVGSWSGPGTTLVITEAGDVSYKSASNGTTSSYSGTLEGFRGNNIGIKAGPMQFGLDVQKPPTKEGGAWKMTVEKNELTRGDGSAPAPSAAPSAASSAED